MTYGSGGVEHVVPREQLLDLKVKSIVIIIEFNSGTIKIELDNTM